MKFQLFKFVLACLWFVLNTSAPAATWTSGTGGSWKTAANWAGSNIPNGIGVTADFSTLDLTADATVTLDGSVTVGSLVFGDLTPSNNWILNTGTGGTLTLGVSSGTAGITVNNQSATIAAVLAGSAPVSKSGTGTLVLAGANTYTGVTLINAGTLTLGSGSALAGGGNLSFGGGTLQFSGSNQGDFSARIVNSGSAISIDTNGQTVTFNTALALSNSGGLIVAGSGTLILERLNNYTGPTTVNAGTVGLDLTAGSLGSGSSAVALSNTASAQIVANYTNWGHSFSIGSLSGGGALGGNVNLQGSTMTVGTDNTSTTFAGVVFSGRWGSGNVIKTGTGTLTLSGLNTYYGTTTVSNGVLAVASTGQIYTGATISSGAVLRLNSWGAGTGGINLNVNTNATAILINGGAIDMASNYTDTGRSFTIGANGATLEVESGITWALNNDRSWQSNGGNIPAIVNNSSLTLDGSGTGQFNLPISGTGSLVKNGTGTWTLSGSNSCTGAMAINSGTLIATGQTNGISALTVSSQAGLSQSGTIAIIGTLALSGSSNLNLVLGSIGSAANIQLTGTYVAPASPVIVNITSLTGFTTGTYNLVTGAGGISADHFVLNSAPAGYVCALSATNGTLALAVVGSGSSAASALGAFGTIGSAFSYQIALAGNATSYAAVGLPAGLSLNASTGLISGTPTAPGTYFATITATSAGGTATGTLILVLPSADGTKALSTSVSRGYFNNVPESAEYTLVYSLDIPSACDFSTATVPYSLDTHASAGSFTRVAYYLELQAPNGTLQYVWTSMNAFTANAGQLGVPTTASGAIFQQAVTGMNVISNVPGVVTGTGLTGNLEFWPTNYSAANGAGVTGASGTVYDWGDTRLASGAYGSMQVGNPIAGQTIFAFNNWGGNGGYADLGIGNNPLPVNGGQDWTFANNANGYSVKSLKVLVLNSATTVTVQPVIDNTLLINPGKGYVEYWGPTTAYTNNFIATGYTRPTWSDVEPLEGVFDWSSLDSLAAAYAKYGRKIGYGIINTNVGMGEQYSTPAWVFQSGSNPQTGSVYPAGANSLAVSDSTSPSGTAILPSSWDDPVYLARMKEFIVAFGTQYNGSASLAFLEALNFGNNGEGNGNFAGISNPSLDSLQNNYYAPYVQAFPNTRLIVPWTNTWFSGTPPTTVYSWWVTQGGGITRDGICSSWSYNGSENLATYPHTPSRMEYANTWAGTVASGTDANTGMRYDSPGELLWYVVGGRPSYMQWQPDFYELHQEFYKMLGNLIGYHFVLQRADVPKTIQSGVSFPLNLTWLNDGIAPLYEPCSVALALLDADNNVVQKQWLAGSNPNGWTPGSSTTESFNVTFPSVPTAYKLAIGLFLDQSDPNPTYKLGIQGRVNNGWYVLSGSTNWAAATWISAAGGSWNTATNWSGNNTVSGIDVVADFSTLNLTADATVTLDGGVTAGSLIFGDTTPGNNWFLNTGSGGPLTLTVSPSAPAPCITVNNQTATLGASFYSNQGLTKSGSGTLVLTGSDALYGNTVVNGGVLEIASSTKLYFNWQGATVTVNAGATLRVNGWNGYGGGWGELDQIPMDDPSCLLLDGGTLEFASAPLGSYTSSRAIGIGAGGATLKNSSSFNWTLSTSGSGTMATETNNSTLTLDGTGASATLAKVISGTGSLIKNGTGMWILNGANTYTGATVINSGTLWLNGATAAIGFNSALTLANTAGAKLYNCYWNGSLNVGANFSLGSLAGGGASGGNVDLVSGTMTVGGDNTSTVYAGSIISSNPGGGNPNGSGGIVKTGAGTLTLSGSSSYRGGTSVAGGTLCVNGVIASPGTMTVVSGGAVSGTGTVASAVSVASGAIVAPGDGTGNAGPLTFSGTLALSGSSSLNFDLGSVGSSDSIRLTGAYVAPGNPVKINVGGLPGFGVGTYTLITGATGIGASSFSLNSTPAGYNCSLSASNGTLFFTVAPSPAITSLLNVAAVIGLPFSYQITASNGPTGFGATNLPPGLGVNPDNGLISGTPTATGTFSSTLSASNAVGTGTATLTTIVLVTTPPPPAITSVLGALGVTGSAFSYQITATNNPTSFGAANLPAGLTVGAGTGLITGTPTTTGTYNSTLSAINLGGTGSASLMIIVAPPPPAITSAPSVAGTMGSVFSYQIAASNGPTSYGATNLPVGLSINSGTGLITGTPTATGTSTSTLSAMNSGGTGNATLTIVILPVPPGAPTGLSATGTNGAVALAWTGSSAATSYNVKRSQVIGSGYSAIATGVSVTTYTDLSVSNGTTYYYVVSAVNAGGESPNSSAASAMPAAPSRLPSPWTNVDIGTVVTTGTSIYDGGGTFMLKGAGSDIGGSADSFQFTYVTTTSTSFSVIARAVTALTSGSTKIGVMIRRDTTNAGARMAGLIFEPNGSSYQARFASRTSTGGTITWSSALTGLVVPQWLKITRAANAYTGYVSIDGQNWTTVGSTSSSAIIGSGGTSYCGMTVCSRKTSSLASETFDGVSAPGWTAPPIVPVGLTATAPSQTQINLSWTAVNGATGYQVLRSPSWSGSYGQIGTPATASYSDTGLAAGTAYYYMVRTTSGSGTSGNSLVVSGTTLPYAPAAPSNLSATGSNAVVTLTWAASNGATSYNVKRSLTSGTGYALVASGIGSTSYGDASVSNGVIYYYVVSAVNPGGESANSVQAAGTPIAPPVITSAATATGTNGCAFSYQITASNTPMSFAIFGFPTWLALNPATGAISGTPTAAGPYTVSISASNAGGTGSTTLTITVQPTPWVQWQTLHFSAAQLVDATVSGYNAAPAGDGIANLLKYALGLDPWTPTVLPVLRDIETVNGSKYLRLTVARNAPPSGLNVTFEVCGDLTTGSWSSADTTVEVNTATSLVGRDTIPISSAPRRFIRLKVTAP